MKKYRINKEVYGVVYTDGGDFTDYATTDKPMLVNERSGEMTPCCGYCHCEIGGMEWFVIFENESEMKSIFSKYQTW